MKKNPFAPIRIPKTPKGSAGYDNQRENIDPHVRTKAMNTRELYVSKHFELISDGTVFEDLRVPAQNTKLNPSKSEPAFEEFIDGLFVLKFDTSNADDESAHFIAQIPHSYKVGSNLYPHVHWSPDNTNTGDVRWQFEYVIASIDDEFSSSATTNTVTAVAAGSVGAHQVNSFPVIDGSGIGISSIIIGRLTRLSQSDAEDTFTGNACFLEFDFHYEIDTLGSKTEFVK